MNQLDNIERIESGSRDKTAGSTFQDQQAFADCVRRQRQAYDERDLAGDIDEPIVDLIKDGRFEEAGMAMFCKMNTTIAERVAQEGWK